MCYNPAFMLKILDKNTGEITYKYNGHTEIKSYEDDYHAVECISVPCGMCVECEQQYSTEWAYRIMLESKLYKDNCMITLTYKNAPSHLIKRDYQLFMKSLRERLSPLKIRYFGSGEYGSKGGRPHFHIIIFGWFPKDAFEFFKNDNYSTYRSPLVESIWKHGYSTVQHVTFEVARYVAKYLQKQQHYPKDYPPFTFMSLKPGIGLLGFDEKCLDSDKIYDNGHYIKVPRYFLKVVERHDIDLSQLKSYRLVKSSLYKRTKKENSKRFEKAIDKLKH